jgi:hypothetical protein
MRAAVRLKVSVWCKGDWGIVIIYGVPIEKAVVVLAKTKAAQTFERNVLAHEWVVRDLPSRSGERRNGRRVPV